MKPRILLPLLVDVAAVHAYDLVREYSGTGFFDAFAFYGSWDNLTNGDVNWLNKSAAYTERLVGINEAQHAIIKVDNSTNVPFNFKRDSVRITSTDAYHFGSLWVIDVLHLPYGCSVWPAIWTNTGINWPSDGEIDIVEGVNLMTQNQMALHTLPGCVQKTPPGQPGKSGANPDCSLGAGCTVLDTTSKATFGQAFAQAGGGVWATQFDVAGVFIWFWNRSDLPASLKNATAPNPLDISSWGPPVASYPSTACDMPKFFGPQQLVIDITLCGDWAGLPQVYPATCSAQAPNNPSPPNPPRTTPTCYPDNVPGPGSPRFDQAYFEISNIRAYTTGGPSPTPSATSVASGGQTTVITTNGGVITLGPEGGIPNYSPSSGARSDAASVLMTWGVMVVVGLVGVLLGAVVV